MTTPLPTTRATITRVLRENARAQGRTYAVAIAAMVVLAVATSTTAWLMQAIFDVMSDPAQRHLAWMVGGAVLGIFVLRGLATYVQQVMLSRAGNRIVATIQKRLYQKLLRQGANFFDATESSDILMRVTQSALSARAIIDTLATGFVRDLLTLIGLIGVMLYQNVTLSLIFLVIGPMALFGVRLVLRKVRSIMALELSSLAEIFKVLQETSAGVRVVKTFQLEDLLTGRMDKAVTDVERRANAMVRLESATVPLMDSLAGLAIATIVVVSASGLIGDTQATPGQLMSFVTALLMAYEPAKRLSRMRVTIEAHVVGVQLLFDLMDRQETLVEAEGAVDLTGGPGEIALRGLEFHYGDGRQVLRGIDTVFRAGEVTALVGPSGGGKSTILNLLLRLQDPTGGGIEIDGVDLRRARLPSLRGAMSYVGQDTFLFSTSILQNIAYGRRGATREEVEAAARAANAHEFILATEHGYDTLVGENGAFLSGGQRQRIAIARAILRNAPILILDEATSALDAQSEAVVRDALLTAMEGRTTVMVTHRLSALKGVQKVCYLEDGRILEEGAIEDLLARRGKFHALWQEQQLSGEAA